MNGGCLGTVLSGEPELGARIAAALIAEPTANAQISDFVRPMIK
jgi:hypothetical protein